MGLHICYELALPGGTATKRVLMLLRELHSNAARLDFDRVTEIREFRGEACALGPEDNCWSDPWPLFKVSVMKHATRAGDADRETLVRPDYAAGFLVLPGRRCEAAAFGFSYGPPLAPVRTPGWHWHYCCKTQYASVVSETHFLRCHLGLLELLDSAAELGIEVTVRDETGYHEHRDEKRLMETVHAENQLIARIAGQFADALDPKYVRVLAPIFEHPRFEEIEGG